VRASLFPPHHLWNTVSGWCEIWLVERGQTGWRALLLRRLLKRVRRARVTGERRAFGETAGSDGQLIWPSVTCARQVHVKRFGFKWSVKSKRYLWWLDRDIIYNLNLREDARAHRLQCFCFGFFGVCFFNFLVAISVWILNDF